MSCNQLFYISLVKTLFIIAAIVAGILNWWYDPYDLIKVPVEKCPDDPMRLPGGICQINEDSIKAAGFTLITVIALFVNTPQPSKILADKMLDSFARILGIGLTFGIGWYWMQAETYGHARDYLIPMLSIVAIALLTIVPIGWLGYYLIRLMKLIWITKHSLWLVLKWIWLRILAVTCIIRRKFSVCSVWLWKYIRRLVLNRIAIRIKTIYNHVKIWFH